MRRERYATDPGFREACAAGYAKYRQENLDALRAYDAARPHRPGDPVKRRARDKRNQPAARERQRKECGFRKGQVAELLIAQGNVCAICRQAFRAFKDGRSNACADHDHTTGLARGVLCYHCNVGLGHYEKRQRATLRIEPYEVYLSAPPARAAA
jgi:hypothetical protein